MSTYQIPSIINDFNLYVTGERLLGITGEVTLPEFSAMTETLSGPGLLGEIEESALGHFSSQQIEIPFRILDREAAKLMDPTEALDLTLRGAAQLTNKNTGALEAKGLRIVIRGRSKGINIGTFKQAGAMNASVTVEIMYILIEAEGETLIELDKLNTVYKVNGKDLLAKIKSLC
mgnify:FL=1